MIGHIFVFVQWSKFNEQIYFLDVLWSFSLHEVFTRLNTIWERINDKRNTVQGMWQERKSNFQVRRRDVASIIRWFTVQLNYRSHAHTMLLSSIFAQKGMKHEVGEFWGGWMELNNMIFHSVAAQSWGHPPLCQCILMNFGRFDTPKLIAIDMEFN